MAPYVGREMGKEDRSHREIFAAWLLDKAEQYSESSCCRAVFDDLVHAALADEPHEDFKHGDLDDILRRPLFKVSQ